MRKKRKEAANRANAAGSPYPAVHEQMQKLRYWYQSKLPNKKLFVLLIMWIKGQLNELDENKNVLHFYRLKSSDQARKNSLRIIKDGGVSWVEYSIPIGDKKYIWMPIPRSFHNFFWRVLQQHSNYDKPLLTNDELNELRDFWRRPVKRNKDMRGAKIANKRVWKTYFVKYCSADSMLSSNSKNLYCLKLDHPSAVAYQKEETEKIRFQLYKTLNNAADRIFREAKIWGVLGEFSREVSGKTVLPFNCIKEASYLTAYPNRIEEIKIIHYQNHRETVIFDNLILGARNAISYDDTAKLFNKLQRGLLEYKVNAINKVGFIRYFNQVTQIFALQFIASTGLRPNHAISPLLSDVQIDRFCIFDKGIARNILLNDFLQQQIKCYQLIKSRLALLIPDINNFPYLFFLVDELQRPVALTAKRLRNFMHNYWNWHVPYSLRKVFSQTLLELYLPTHLIDRVMGHYQLGEHFGVVNILQFEEEKILQVLNQLPSIFKMELFRL